MRNFILLLSMLILIGCQTYTPVVDPQSVSPEKDDKYYRDQAECKALASQSTGGARFVARDTVVGGAVGTGTGALIGTIAGDTGKGLAYGAVIGGLAGGARGVYQSNKEYETVYRNCVKQRGYDVLN